MTLDDMSELSNDNSPLLVLKSTVLVIKSLLMMESSVSLFKDTLIANGELVSLTSILITLQLFGNRPLVTTEKSGLFFPHQFLSRL